MHCARHVGSHNFRARYAVNVIDRYATPHAISHHDGPVFFRRLGCRIPHHQMPQLRAMKDFNGHIAIHVRNGTRRQHCSLPEMPPGRVPLPPLQSDGPVRRGEAHGKKGCWRRSLS